MMISDATSSQSVCTHQRPRPSHESVIQHFGSSLSTEDQEMMLERVQSMRDEGATHREIKTYVDETLSALGVELPHLAQRSEMRSAQNQAQDQDLGQRGARRDVIQDLGDQLDEDLRTELMALIKSLREEGALFEGIKEVIDAKLSEHGIEHPPPPGSLINRVG